MLALYSVDSLYESSGLEVCDAKRYQRLAFLMNHRASWQKNYILLVSTTVAYP